MCGKGTVRSIEQVMRFIKDVAQRTRFAFTSKSCLDQHQSMVGDDDFRVPGAAHRMFDKAFAVMGARRIDAFTPGICQIGRRIASEKMNQPRRKITADHIAVSATFDPARNQAQRDGVRSASDARSV